MRKFLALCGIIATVAVASPAVANAGFSDGNGGATTGMFDGH